MANRFHFLARLWANWITLTGSILTTISGISIVLVIALDLVSGDGNPYSSALIVLALPFVFIVGLILIPFGLWVDRRRRRTSRVDAPADPVADAFKTAFASRSARARILFVAAFTLANILLFGMAGQEAIHYMDTPKFCGTSCHTVMQPEWDAYNLSPHSRVACVACHIGPGASSEISAKINGLHQLWGVLSGGYHRPIPTPVERLRTGRDTCQQCHSPGRYAGNRAKVFSHYQEDAANTPAYNAMMLHVGGRDPRSGKYRGIHWHLSDTSEVRYEFLDHKRDKIGKITVLEGGKTVAEYVPGPKTRALPVLGVRTMDCTDCHNRAAHIFDLSIKSAVDGAMAAGRLDVKTEWLAKVANDVLTAAKDIPREGAEGYFLKALTDEYRKAHPEVKISDGVLAQASRTLADAYRHDVYPQMRLGWGNYPSKLGHQSDSDNDSVGCFRCHDGEHEAKTPDGKSTKTLSQDCELCHEALANEEDPAKSEELQKLMP